MMADGVFRDPGADEPEWVESARRVPQLQQSYAHRGRTMGVLAAAVGAAAGPCATPKRRAVRDLGEQSSTKNPAQSRELVLAD